MKAIVYLALALMLSGCATFAPTQPMPAIPPEVRALRAAQPPTPPCGLDGLPANQIMRYFPMQAMDAGIQGWVLAEFTVGLDGRVTRAEALHSAPVGVFEGAATRLLRDLPFPTQESECTRLMLIHFAIPE
jgi:TonB family protein